MQWNLFGHRHFRKNIFQQIPTWFDFNMTEKLYFVLYLCLVYIFCLLF